MSARSNPMNFHSPWDATHRKSSWPYALPASYGPDVIKNQLADSRVPGRKMTNTEVRDLMLRQLHASIDRQEPKSEREMRAAQRRVLRDEWLAEQNDQTLEEYHDEMLREHGSSDLTKDEIARKSSKFVDDAAQNDRARPQKEDLQFGQTMQQQDEDRALRPVGRVIGGAGAVHDALTRIENQAAWNAAPYLVGADDQQFDFPAVGTSGLRTQLLHARPVPASWQARLQDGTNRSWTADEYRAYLDRLRTVDENAVPLLGP